MPEVELRADFDRDGRLSGSATEYAARTAGHGAVVAINLDRDGRSIPAAARVERPVQLDHALPTKTGADGDPIALQVVVSTAAVARFTSLALRVAGDNAEALALVDSRARVVRPASARVGQVEFALPLRAGRHAFRLEASRVPGSPLGQADGALRLSAVARDAAGVESTVDESRLLMSRFLVLDDLAAAQALYICNLPDNVPSVRDVRAGVASARPPVTVREVALADNVGDGWVQDQFQLGYMVAPGRTMRALLHMPRFRTNAQLGATQRNLAELVRTHFPSTDLGLIDDFWQRTVPLEHQGGTARLSFTDSEAAFRVLHRVVSAQDFLRDALERLCAAAGSLGISPAPTQCTNLPPPMLTVPSLRLQLPELERRVEAVVRQLLPEATSSQRTGIEALRDRVRRVMREVNRTLAVSGTQGSEVFELLVSGTTFRLEAAALLELHRVVEEMHDSLVYGGNIEASPPVDGHPFGKIVIGEGDVRPLDGPLRELFDSSSEVQPVVTVDTTWLAVGHVDEVLTFLPDRASDGHVVLRASPEVAVALIDKASDLYFGGVSIHHPDRIQPWRPLTTARHRMSAGSHPVTRLFRGKLWLHAHPRATAYGSEEGGTPDDYQDMGEVLNPPRIYLRMVDWYDGLLTSSLAPYYPDSTQDVHYYSAALSAWELEFFEGGTNEVIVEEQLTALDELLADEFPALPVHRVPVVFDRAPLGDESPRLGVAVTAAFTPNLVNLQFVNGTVLIPHPFGPRMAPADAAAVVAGVLRDEGLGAIAGRVSPRYFTRHRLDTVQVWLNASLQDGRIQTPFGSAADLAREFADGFPGVSWSEIESRIQRANRSAFDASGRLRDGWRLIKIPERTVDLFQAYTHVILDALGLRAHWVDSWFYHVRLGEIHCGTNVLRTVPRTRTPWWDRIPVSSP